MPDIEVLAVEIKRFHGKSAQTLVPRVIGRTATDHRCLAVFAAGEGMDAHPGLLVSRVQVSDVHRTVIDLLDDPSVGGGIQHVADCLMGYLRHENRDDDLLIDYAGRFGNGAVFKRLGFLVENHRGVEALEQACKTRLTSGNARLDPRLDCSRLVSRWRLWVPANWAGSRAHD